MEDGTGSYSYTDDEIQSLAFLNIHCNLKATEECFKCLLNIIENRAASNNEKALSALHHENEIDIENIVNLCVTNAALIENILGLLSKEKHQHFTHSKNDFYSISHTFNSTDTAKHTTKLTSATPYKDRKMDLQQEFRESIVSLMIISLQCWEHCTKKNKIDLAEESNIWRINIDGGRLRVRSMERYLNVHKLPKVPRWRDVLKTAYFVLDNVNSNSAIRKKLEESLDHTLHIMRMQSL